MQKMTVSIFLFIHIEFENIAVPEIWKVIF